MDEKNAQAKSDSLVSANSDKEEAINGTIGVVTLNEKETKSDTIKLYNEDGSLWYAFSFNYDSAKGFDRNNDFNPFVFHPHDNLMALRCINKEKGRYQVIANEKTNDAKYVKADDKALKFQTWKQHVLSVFSVGFDPDENPIYKSNSDKAEVIPFDNDNSYFPVKVDGDWLQINWGTEKAPSLGWIKWKSDKKLLVQLNYLD